MNKRKRGWLWWLFVLLLTELSIIFIVVPHSWVSHVGSLDRGYNYQWFGEHFEFKVLTDAQSWFDTSMVETGIQQSTYDFLISKWENHSAMSFDDRGLKELTKDRLDTFWAAVSVAFYRLSETLKWLIYLCPLLLAVFFDGIVQREINKWKFFMPSPLIHSSTKHVITGALLLFIFIPFLPIPLLAPIFPVLILITMWTIWVAITNLSKRI